MQNPDPSTSLLRCTLKKSLHTTERLVVAAACVIDTVAALACIFLFGEAILPAILASVAFVIALVLSIPWYFYAIAAIPVAIVGYSFLWCVAREFTEEDWKNSQAASSTFAVVLLAMSLCVVATLVISVTIDPHGENGMFIPVVVVGAGIMTTMVAIYGETNMYCFLGALYHYYRRTR